MEVIVRLRAAPSATDPVLAELRDIAARFGATARAMHANTQDPNLGAYFVIEVSDAGEANRLIGALTKTPAVDGAYVKPADAMP